MVVENGDDAVGHSHVESSGIADAAVRVNKDGVNARVVVVNRVDNENVAVIVQIIAVRNPKVFYVRSLITLDTDLQSFARTHVGITGNKRVGGFVL